MSWGPKPKSATEDDLSSAGNFSLNVVIRYGSLVGLTGHFLFIFLFLWLGIPIMVAFNAVSCAVFVLAFWINQRAYTHLALLLGSLEIVVHACLAVAYLGWDSSFHAYILGLVPLILSSKRWRTQFKFFLTALLAMVYLVLFVYSQRIPPWVVISSDSVLLIGIFNILTLFFVFSVISHFNLSATTHAETALKKVNKTLEYLVQIDPLTKLCNRRSMLLKIAAEIDRFRFCGDTFSLVMCDIDHFKEINDTFGHDAGDQVLTEIAEILKSCVREQDQVSRWGGEEFLILLPQTSLAHAERIAERTRDQVASTAVIIGQVERKVTITLGVSTYACDLETSVCIRQADQAMYQGKRRGRNCVVVAT